MILNCLEKKIHKQVTNGVTVLLITIAADMEFADTRWVEAKMKSGQWLCWDSIEVHTEAVNMHPWYRFGHAPPVPTEFNLEELQLVPSQREDATGRNTLPVVGPAKQGKGKDTDKGKEKPVGKGKMMAMAMAMDNNVDMEGDQYVHYDSGGFGCSSS